MYCTKCGTYGEGKFCIKCGNKLEQEIDTSVEPFLDETINPIETKKKNGFLQRHGILNNILTGHEYKQELEDLRSTFTPEMRDADRAIQLRNEVLSDIESLQQKAETLDKEIQEKQSALNELHEKYIEMDDAVLLQSFGLYEPKFDFANSDEYKEKLNKIREQQKAMLRTGTAASGNMQWEVNGSRTEGKKLVKNMQKLLLRSFNNECDAVIGKVKYSNFDQACERIKKAETAISKLGVVMDIRIDPKYLKLKIKELHLAHEYQEKKQEEKEEQAELRAQAREEAKLQKEIEAELKKLKKEKEHYKNALEKVNQQIDSSTNPSAELNEKKAKILERLDEIKTAEEDVDYRAANLRAGYVYVISNIGSFGENVYKIGMTRRLDPNERIYELGDASVPFNFDIHAMIFSEDAPKLENALHHAFADRKINLVNQRREFFNVTLDEIKEVIKEVIKENYEKTAEFIDLPDAEQYRISEKMRKKTSAK